MALPVDFSGRRSEVGLQGVPHQLRLVGAVVAPWKMSVSEQVKTSLPGSWDDVSIPLDTVHNLMLLMQFNAGQNMD